AYLLYFRRVLPAIGRAVSKHTDAYSYLPESVLAFPEPDAFAARLTAAGFRDVGYQRLTGGIAALPHGARYPPRLHWRDRRRGRLAADRPACLYQAGADGNCRSRDEVAGRRPGSAVRAAHTRFGLRRVDARRRQSVRLGAAHGDGPRRRPS